MVINNSVKVKTMKNYPYVDTTRANANGTFPVYIIVKNQRGRFFVNTGITTCGKLNGLVFPKGDRAARQKTMLLGRYLSDVEAICLNSGLTSTDNKVLKAQIQQEVFGVQKESVAETLEHCVLDFAQEKTGATRGIYELTARKVARYDKKAVLRDVDAAWLDGFRQHFLDAGMSINGVGKELRNIRAVFNWARRKGRVETYPFFDYRIVEQETEPNCISVDDLRRLRAWPCEPWQRPYVDFFFLSFYMAGINPVDLLSLKADAVKDGHVSFVRRKTDKEGCAKVRTVTLPVLPEAQEIISRWPSREGWLTGWMDCRSDYKSFVREANDALKKVGRSWKVKDKAGKLRKMAYEPICPNITMYSARYSFGSIAANELDISERTIGMCLGHSWAKNVTARYMSNDQRKVDNAVKRVVGYVGEEGRRL